jgi:hypothetical protein
LESIPGLHTRLKIRDLERLRLGMGNTGEYSEERKRVKGKETRVRRESGIEGEK